MSKQNYQQHQQNQRRKLRSAAKALTQTSQIKDSPLIEKDSDSIKAQIDHIYNNNGSLSTYPLFEDAKILPESFAEKDLILQSNKKSISVNIIPSFYDEVSFENKNIHNNLEIQQNSVQQMLQSKQNFLNKEQIYSTPNSKQHLRGQSFTQHSPYMNQKMSYRKDRKSNNITSVPYRKCQDQFQQKVVNTLNKLFNGKVNQKQMDNFNQKIPKISNKDLFNPYVISGIQTILQIAEEKKALNITSINKLKNEVKNLKMRIMEELGKTNEYHQIQTQIKFVNIQEIRPKIMKRIYKLLLESQQIDISKARQKSFNICQKFFNKQCSIKQYDVVCFFEEQKFLIQ